MRLARLVLLATLICACDSSTSSEEEVLDSSEDVATADMVQMDDTSADTPSDSVELPSDVALDIPDANDPDVADTLDVTDTSDVMDTADTSDTMDMQEMNLLLGDGQACLDDTACEGGRCGAVFMGNGNSVQLCAQFCDAAMPNCADGQFCFIPGDIAGDCLISCPADRPCEDGLNCVKLPLTASQEDHNACMPVGGPALLPLGHTCTDSAECAVGECGFVYVGAPGPMDACHVPCGNPGDPLCPSGTACFVGGGGYCLPDCSTTGVCADARLTCFTLSPNEGYCLFEP